MNKMACLIMVLASLITVVVVTLVDGRVLTPFKLLKRASRSLLEDQTVKCNATAEGPTPTKFDCRSPIYYSLTLAADKNSSGYNVEALLKEYANRTNDTLPYDVDAICSENATLRNSDHRDLRGDCPFTWKLNYNAKRLPQYMMEAQCLCHTPKRKRAAGAGVEEKCEKIVNQVPVLFQERCSAVTVTQYRLGIESIVVGCSKTTSLVIIGDSMAAHQQPREKQTE